MAVLNVGRIRPVYKAEWVNGQAYQFLDWIIYDGSSYMCINQNGAPSGKALTNKTYWAKIAGKGEKGDTGNSGAVTTPATSEADGLMTAVDKSKIDFLFSTLTGGKTGQVLYADDNGTYHWQYPGDLQFYKSVDNGD